MMPRPSIRHRRLTGFLCVIFFVIHGAELDLTILAGRCPRRGIHSVSSFGHVGVFAAATFSHEPPAIRSWLGTTLLAQAGAAIALASVTAADPRLGEIIQPLILGPLLS